MSETTASAVRVEEPELPRRVRRPVDVVRLLAVLVFIALLAGLAAAASGTTIGLESDLAAIGRGIPQSLLGLVAVAAALGGLALLPGMVITRLVQRRLWSAGMITVAVPFALLLSYAVASYLRGPAPGSVADDFVPPDGTETVATVSGFVAALVAAATVASLGPRGRQAFTLVITAALATGLLAGGTSVLSAALSLALGRLAGLVVRLGAGSSTVRPGGHTIAALLTEHGLDVAEVKAAETAPLRTYQATMHTGAAFDVVVIDRDRLGAGLLPRLWQLVRTRGELLPREEVTLAGSAERRTATALAAAGAGVRTPRLVLAVAAEPDAVVVAYEHVETTAMSEVAPESVTDESLVDAFAQLGRLHAFGIAHRSVSPQSVRFDEQGQAWLYDTSTGQVAASSFARSLDVAQGLTATAAVVGAERAVATARTALGTAVVARSAGLLQPIALPAATRVALRGQSSVLTELRALAADGDASGPPTRPVQLERFKPRTLLTALGLVVALYLIGSELVGVDLGAVVDQSDWRWVAIGFAGVVVTYVGSAASLLGFVREKVSYWRAIGAQLALSFVKLVAPSAVGNAAVNVRMLMKAGLSEPAAAAAMAAGQIAAVVVTVPLLLVLGLLTGQAVASGLAPSPTALGIVAIVVVLLALLLLVRPVRDRLRHLWEGFVEQGLPSLLETLQRPSKLAQGVGGNLLLTAGYTLCLYACVRAVGADIPIAVAAVVFLTGNTVGTAVPTPGGLGAVEAALAAGLSAGGVTGGLAVPAVLLFRILSFWLPLLPGYIAWTTMQRRGWL